jgi:signal transduction histidine kinase
MHSPARSRLLTEREPLVLGEHIDARFARLVELASGAGPAVEDSGTGIDRGYVHRIFDAFFTTKPHGM